MKNQLTSEEPGDRAASAGDQPADRGHDDHEQQVEQQDARQADVVAQVARARAVSSGSPAAASTQPDGLAARGQRGRVAADAGHGAVAVGLVVGGGAR